MFTIWLKIYEMCSIILVCHHTMESIHFELNIDQYFCTVCGKQCNPQYYIVCVWVTRYRECLPPLLAKSVKHWTANEVQSVGQKLKSLRGDAHDVPLLLIGFLSANWFIPSCFLLTNPLNTRFACIDFVD